MELQEDLKVQTCMKQSCDATVKETSLNDVQFGSEREQRRL